MADVSHNELREAEARVGTAVARVAADVGELKTQGALHGERIKTISVTQGGHGKRIESQDASITEVYTIIKSATTGVSALRVELARGREAKIADDKAAAAAAAAAEVARVAWWKDWRGVVTPQNFVALIVILSAVGAWVQGQMDTAQLLEEVKRSQAIVSPAPTPDPEDPESSP